MQLFQFEENIGSIWAAVRSFDEELEMLDTDADGEEGADIDVDESIGDIHILFG
jgi:hypothetical protein